MPSPSLSRRRFLGTGLLLGAGALLGRAAPAPPRFKLSLAQWSLRHRLNTGALGHLDFPRIARDEFGLAAVEYVSTFFRDRHTDPAYLAELRRRTDDLGVTNVLIMVDLPGPAGELASPDRATREAAARHHFPWVEAARHLGCHAIRVNARGYGAASFSDAQDHFIPGLGLLADHAATVGLNVLVENHGGFSSHGRWLAEVLHRVGRPNCGSLPDFGNFIINAATGERYDPAQGVAELLPFAKGVSAKAHQIGPDGAETTIDYPRLLGLVRASAFSGYIGIEWGGGNSPTSPEDGIRGTKRLLERLLPL